MATPPRNVCCRGRRRFVICLRSRRSYRTWLATPEKWTFRGKCSPSRRLRRELSRTVRAFSRTRRGTACRRETRFPATCGRIGFAFRVGLRPAHVAPGGSVTHPEYLCACLFYQSYHAYVNTRPVSRAGLSGPSSPVSPAPRLRPPVRAGLGGSSRTGRAGGPTG